MQVKRVYLTIDDSPSDDFKEKVDFLKSKNIRAVFFCRGDMLEDKKELGVYAVNNGFVLGNHTYSHDFFSKIPLEKCFDEIEKTDALIKDIYRMAGIAWEHKYFRFPYGDKGGMNFVDYYKPILGEGKERKDKIQNFLREHGYTKPSFDSITYKFYEDSLYRFDVDWFWTFDVMEWRLHTASPNVPMCEIDEIYRRIDTDAPEERMGLNCFHSEDIVLMHDHVETSKQFKTIIQKLLDKNIHFVLPE